MTSPLPTKTLIIGVIKKDDSILLRKKFKGSKPYTETWYSFGTEYNPDETPADTFIQYIKETVGIDVRPTAELSQSTETKPDPDGIQKQFIYLNLECEYISGDISIPPDLETVAWIPLQQLAEIDIVPPSVALFKRLGFLV